MKGAGVFVLRDEQTLVPMKPASFASEDDFQRLLGAFPELLVGDQLDAADPRRFVLVSREQAIADEEGGAGRWSLDHLFLDQDGVPTLVEVKRSSDTRLRREVVGQMLDYAANCVLYWPVEELRARFEARCTEEGTDPAQALANLAGPTGPPPDAYWTQVKTNLAAGKIRLLFVADQIPPELRRVVEFLNRQMQPAEVLAIELRQYEGQGLRTLVPLVIGQTQDALQRKGGGPGRISPPKRRWDEDGFMAALRQECGPAIGEQVRLLMDWTKARADSVYFGSGASIGSFGAVFEHAGQSLMPFVLYTNGWLAVQFPQLAERPVFGAEAKRRELLDRLNAAGFGLPETALTKRRELKPETWLRGGDVSGLLTALDWFAAELRTAA